MNKKPNTTLSPDKLLADLVSFGLEKNTEKVELVAITLARTLKKTDPVSAKRIEDVISSFSLPGRSALRGVDTHPLPTDSDSHLEMATLISPNKDIYVSPILNSIIKERIANFLEERANISLLLEKNIKPSTSILLVGHPGTGKTMLAHHLASVLEKNLVVLDLSASISSLLGKTGHNLKKVLQYARQTSSVLLLDEFDAIAKKRDDTTDLGELKRVVNVLLMELESWPVSSVVIATSNHPELLDRAIWRRFEHVIELPLPEFDERVDILTQELQDFFTDEKAAKLILSSLAELLEQKSAADICRFSENVKRRIVLKNEEVINACLHELEIYTNDKKIKGKFCLVAKKVLGKKITVRELATITGLSPAGVQHHLSKINHE